VGEGTGAEETLSLTVGREMVLTGGECESIRKNLSVGSKAKEAIHLSSGRSSSIAECECIAGNLASLCGPRVFVTWSDGDRGGGKTRKKDEE